ncbi:MAG: Sulfate transporter, CysZ-type [uncultured Thiotrichaceae bacterium]|uniref:Sulfate transporter, CysZ-type n=1 Tax=uncultured Thiotrichaceae bacterium TaxID=298394 RepID=A0A6S6UDN7_9GAMM|nr:MAG: Sulfate transporter, CysZ-type [uncultured Thiotrichaceae bacterium]
MRFIEGFLTIFSGIRLLTTKGIRRFALVPILINIVIFSTAIYVASKQFDQLMERLLSSISWLPGWLASGIEWVLWPLFAIMILIAIYYSFTLLANLIAAPFNALLAQKIEQHLRDDAKFEEEGAILPLVARTVGSEVKKYAHMFKWLIALLILTVIPGLNIIAPFAWVIYGAWMLAIEYADYTMGNHGMFFKEELRVLRKNRMAALGLGSGSMLMTMIPVVNLIAMPASVAAGTVLWVKRLSNNQ